MTGQSAMDYWESVLGARHIVLGKSHEALLEDYLALSTIFQRHGARVNAHSPTARIPAELLQHTFRLLRDIVERERSETTEDMHDSKADYKNGRPRPPIWSVVTRVCSRWRMIAHDDRFLWQDIRILPIEPWVKHMLKLAKFSKIHVRARLPDVKKTGHILYALLCGRDGYANSHRISSLDISTDDGHYATKALYECTRLPSLERVTIRLDDEPGPYGTTRRELHWERFLARAPKLRSISVSGYTLNGGGPRQPCTSLTRLSLSGGEKHRQLGLGPQMKAESLLRSLECMPALQELVLDDIVPLPAEAQAALLLRKKLSIQVAHVTFRHRDLPASLPFISVLSSLAIQLTLHTDRADESTLSTLLNHAPLKLPDPGFL
ncbi:hypothetical protein PENSPDRAFT_176345 [Peniophora sp. CONT]|nr:hypothetical protein PENSPDRAFT_176345 [Peniophora sp. CONT]